MGLRAACLRGGARTWTSTHVVRGGGGVVAEKHSGTGTSVRQCANLMFDGTYTMELYPSQLNGEIWGWPRREIGRR